MLEIMNACKTNRVANRELIKESLSYPGALLFEEMFSFYQKASQETIEEMEALIQSNKVDEAIGLLEQCLGIDLSKFKNGGL